MVLVSAAFLPIPAMLVTTGLREVLTMAPPAPLLEQIHDIVSDAICAQQRERLRHPDPPPSMSVSFTADRTRVA